MKKNKIAFSDCKPQAMQSALWKLLNSFPPDLVQGPANIEDHGVPASTELSLTGHVVEVMTML